MFDPHHLALPFFLGVTAKGAPKLNIPRIIEAIIIAAIVAGVTMYGQSAVLATKIESLQTAIDDIKENQKENQRVMRIMQKDIYTKGDGR